jgi:hypothetical protein
VSFNTRFEAGAERAQCGGHTINPAAAIPRSIDRPEVHPALGLSALLAKSHEEEATMPPLTTFGR